MGQKEDAPRNNENVPVIKRQKIVPRERTFVSTTNKNKKHKNVKQIFILSFDALRESKATSALTGCWYPQQVPFV
jgi:hypothetical protein